MRVLLALLVLCLVASTATAKGVSGCLLSRGADSYIGSCGTILDEKPALMLRPASQFPTSHWRDDVQPIAAWTGTMTNSDGVSPLILEIYKDGRGIMRTEYGWFGVSHFTQASDLRFELDAAHEVKPNALDRKIVERAAAILSSDAVWNRKDDRKCPSGAKMWSLYCAMQQGTIEITGAADHRRPAMEAVRLVIEARTKNRNYEHRLMDYNNDPTTALADVQGVFQAALAGMDDPAWLAANGFSATPPF